MAEAALPIGDEAVVSGVELPDPKTCKHRFVEREVYECEHCNKAFTTSYNLTRHKKGNCQENVCQKCNLRFQKTEQLKDHNLICTGKQAYQCEFCGKAFVKGSNLSRHRQTHTERCELCKALFYKRIPLITLFPEEQIFHCKHCEEKFKSPEALDKHYLSHYESNVNQCTLCYLAFAKKRHLVKHTQKEHPSLLPPTKARKTYECSVCHRVFLKKKDRKKHLQIHIEAGMKIHSCKVCGKSYTAQKTLKMHMIKHGSDDKKPRCKICNKMFSHPFSLRYHMRIHNNSKPCVCKICDQAFRQAGHLKRHLLTHTDVPKEKRERKFKCGVCNKLYASDQDLKHHKFTHTGEKKFNCNFCGKAFLFKRTLNHHINIHTGAKPYSCDLCDKAFAQPGSLHKHKQTHAEFKSTNQNAEEHKNKLQQPHARKILAKNEPVVSNNIEPPHLNGVIQIQAPPPQQMQQPILVSNQLQPIINSPEVDNLQRMPEEHLLRAPANYRTDCLEQIALQHVHLQFQSPFKHKQPNEMPPNPYWAQHMQQPNLVHYHQPNHAMNRNAAMFLPPNNHPLQ